MTDRISDEQLASLATDYEWDGIHENGKHSQEYLAFYELQQSRALISQNNELLEKLHALVHSYIYGPYDATWIQQMDALLSAHGAQGDKQADAEGTRE